MNRKLATITAAVAAAVLATACSHRDEPAQPDATIGVGLSFPQADEWVQVPTRAEGDPDPAVMRADMPDDIGVFASVKATGADAVFNNQKMYYRLGEAVKTSGIDITAWPASNDWPYTPAKKWIASSDYKFFAYTPWTDFSAYGTEYTASYDNFNSLVLTGCPPMAATDYMISRGMFMCNSADEATRQPMFRMMHLMSRLVFRFKVGEEYSKLRDIRLRRVSVIDNVYANAVYSVCRLDFTQYPSGTWYRLEPTPIPYTGSDQGIDLACNVTPDHTGLPGMLLTVDYKYYASLYVAMPTLQNLIINVEYDVYDKQGQLLRPNQTATNTLALGDVFDQLLPGCYYDIFIVVSPKYLYVLSDNDVVPDGLIDVTM